MPTKKQLHRIWAAEFANPSIRRTDDPMYVNPTDLNKSEMNDISAVPKSDKTKRIEIHLLPEIVEQLKALADKENRSLKNYMETVPNGY